MIYEKHMLRLTFLVKPISSNSTVLFSFALEPGLSHQIFKLCFKTNQCWSSTSLKHGLQWLWFILLVLMGFSSVKSGASLCYSSSGSNKRQTASSRLGGWTRGQAVLGHSHANPEHSRQSCLWVRGFLYSPRCAKTMVQHPTREPNQEQKETGPERGWEMQLF